jgi:hypothetical protein
VRSLAQQLDTQKGGHGAARRQRLAGTQIVLWLMSLGSIMNVARAVVDRWCSRGITDAHTGWIGVESVPATEHASLSGSRLIVPALRPARSPSTEAPRVWPRPNRRHDPCL